MHLQLCCKESAHFVGMVRITLDVVIHLLLPVLPFARTDGRRACSHVGHGARQRGYPGVTCRSRAPFTSYSGVSLHSQLLQTTYQLTQLFTGSKRIAMLQGYSPKPLYRVLSVPPTAYFSSTSLSHFLLRLLEQQVGVWYTPLQSMQLSGSTH